MKRSSYIAIDYSGEGVSTRRLSKLQVFEASGMDSPQCISSPASKPGKMLHWTREEVAAWIVARAHSGECFIAGIDHAFSLPFPYFQKFGLDSWDSMLKDFCIHWDGHPSGKSIKEMKADNPRFYDDHNLFRLTDQWTQSALSVFRWLPGPTVTFSTHAGIPWLAWIREQARGLIHFWPFDGWDIPPDKAVLVEIYPALYKRRYRHQSVLTNDAWDAWASARWLQDMDARGALERYFAPPLTSAERELARLEGWILGVG